MTTESARTAAAVCGSKTRPCRSNWSWITLSISSSDTAKARAKLLDRHRLGEGDAARVLGNAAFYLSIPPAMFPTVLKQMARTGMAESTPERNDA